uniref:DUF7808 domain-containing protein n=1 Tax=Ascaris lumbricoides TaxID=6252 RepID=A0A9J2PFZ4_ASCLU
TRKLICNSISGHNVSRCALHLPNVKPEQNPDCHEDLDKHNTTRVYCRIMCEESDDTTVLAKVPTWNHACNVFYTYQLERLRKDWYLWRSGGCLNTTITFDVRCGFARDSHVFYRENSKLFEYDDAPDKGKHHVNRFRPR